ncbi:MAG: TRAP transporter large permease subunit [Dehalococcoidia bacterium]|nr:TRAP transporter large permease subunit [Dehalococcoidia bacterium]
MSIFVFGVLFLLLFAGFSIALSLGISSTAALYYFTNIPLTAIPQKIYTNLDTFPLLAVPFFILASNIFAVGGVADRIIRLSNTMFGHVHGGLAISGVAACALFAAVSGSSPATVVAIGGIMIPAMIRAGYGRSYAVGSMATAGALGIMIPPSIPMVLYGFATNESVGKLFLAGVLPGIFQATALALVCYVVARRANYQRDPAATWGERWAAVKYAAPSMLLPTVIIGGIYSGVFTPTEAAAVAVLVGIVVGMFIHRELALKDFPRIFIETGKTSAMLMFIITMAQLFAFVLTIEQIPHAIASAVVSVASEPWMILLLINFILLLAGDFMDPAPIILIMAPIFHPIAKAVGIDPIHLGIIMTMNMEIGLITPPVGLNLYVASGIAEMPLYTVMRAAAPWIVVQCVVLAVVTYWPDLSLFLPTLLYK